MLNKLKLVLAGSIAAAAMISSSAHAEEVTVPAEAKIVSAITLNLAGALNFGSIAVPGTAGGADTVTLADTATGDRVCGADLVCFGTPSNATLTVTSTSGEVVSVSYQASVDLDNQDVAGESMTLTPSLSSGASGSTFLSDGSEAIYVGGTLSVATDQVGGTYEGSFPITVEYN